MCVGAALRNLHTQARKVAVEGILGDIVECGVCNGGSAASIALGFGDQRRLLWLYDSFEGLPEPKEVDGSEAVQWSGKCVGSVEKVYDALAIARVDPDRIRLQKGWFEETFRGPLPEHIAFLHIDADWYDSVLLSLETFYDRVAEGGVIVLDDFGYWRGCREAFRDFFAKRTVVPVLENSGDDSQRHWIKGRSRTD